MDKNRVLKYLSAVFGLMLCAGVLTACKPDPFAYEKKIFDDSFVHEFEITLSEEDCQDLLTRAVEKNKYIGTVKIDGKNFQDVQVCTKGALTLISTAMQEDTDSYSLKLKFDYGDTEGACYGLDSLHLNNNYSDPSKLKDHLAYEMFAFLGVPAPLTSYAHVTLNGEDLGLYLAVEGMERSFLNRNGLEDAELYKSECAWYEDYITYRCELIQEAMDNGTFTGDLETFGNNLKLMMEFLPRYWEEHGLSETDSLYLGSDLKYTGPDPENYAEIFDNSEKHCTDKDKVKVIKALKNLSEMKVEKALDTKEVISYFAVNNFVFNADGIQNKHNYYLVENGGLLMILPWDYNLAMPEGYLSEESGYVNYHAPIDEVMDALGGGEDAIWKWIPAEETRLEEYHEALDTLMTGYVDSGLCEKEIDRVDAMIRPYVEKDPSNLCSLGDYDRAVSNVREFLRLRTADIRKELEGL